MHYDSRGEDAFFLLSKVHFCAPRPNWTTRWLSERWRLSQGKRLSWATAVIGLFEETERRKVRRE